MGLLVTLGGLGTACAGGLGGGASFAWTAGWTLRCFAGVVSWGSIHGMVCDILASWFTSRRSGYGPPSAISLAPVVRKAVAHQHG